MTTEEHIKRYFGGSREEYDQYQIWKANGDTYAMHYCGPDFLGIKLFLSRLECGLQADMESLEVMFPDGITEKYERTKPEKL